MIITVQGLSYLGNLSACSTCLMCCLPLISYLHRPNVLADCMYVFWPTLLIENMTVGEPHGCVSLQAPTLRGFPILLLLVLFVGALPACSCRFSVFYLWSCWCKVQSFSLHVGLCLCIQKLLEMGPHSCLSVGDLQPVFCVSIGIHCSRIISLLVILCSMFCTLRLVLCDVILIFNCKKCGLLFWLAR